MISIVMPAYNSAAFISNAIESVIAQTNGNWELIIVNDGSSDNTIDIISKYQEGDKRIKLFSQINTGPSSARHNGVCHSSGEWITFLDADDCLEQNAVQIFEDKSKSGISGIYIFSHHIGWKYHEITINYDEYRLAAICQEFNTGPWSKLFKRSLFNDKVFDSPDYIKSGEDWLMNIRLAFNLISSATFCREIVYNYNEDANPLSLMKLFKGSWNYSNLFYEELLASIPESKKSKYCKEILTLLSKEYHNAWRKKWILPKEAKNSFIYKTLSEIQEHTNINMPFFQMLDLKVEFPAIRFALDITERGFGVIKKLLYKPRHRYFDQT